MNYFDIFASKKYSHLLYKHEHDNICSSKTLRFERQMLEEKAFFFNKLLLGTTLLPKSIAEALVESDPAKAEAFKAITKIWSSEKCPDCLIFYKSIRKIRIVERYLFLRYQTMTLGNLK